MRDAAPRTGRAIITKPRARRDAAKTLGIALQTRYRKFLESSGDEDATVVATADLAQAFFQLTDYPVEDRAKVPAEDIDVGGGRTLHVPKSLKGVAVFSFKKLLGQPRGAADYLAVARRYHTVILVGIPTMGPEMRNEASRFTTFVDALYEHKVKLLAAADAEPEGLYPAGDASFEFQRTISRLEEMRSAEYLAEGRGAAA